MTDISTIFNLLSKKEKFILAFLTLPGLMSIFTVVFVENSDPSLLAKEGVETVGICTHYRSTRGKSPRHYLDYKYYVDYAEYSEDEDFSIGTEVLCFGTDIENQMYRVVYAPSDPTKSWIRPTKPINELVEYGVETTATIDSLQYSNNRKRWIVVVGYDANGEKVESEKRYEKLPPQLKLHQIYNITYSKYRLHKDLPSCFEFDFEY